MSARDIVLCHPVRTAIGTFSGTLKSLPATELGAIVVRETLRRAGIGGDEIGTVVMGNVIQAGNRMNPARQSAIGGGLPVSVPAMTVNPCLRLGGTGHPDRGFGNRHWRQRRRHCWRHGEYGPRALPDGWGRWGYRMGPGQILDSMLTDGLNDAFSGEHSGWHTEDLVEKLQITRIQQDAFAARSQQRFATAQKAGHFTDEIVAVEIKGRKGAESFAIDEAPRPGTSVETLSRLNPAFRRNGTITAGNAPGLNSAAAAMIVATRSFAEAKGIEPMGRLAGYGIAAVEPGLFGLGPVPAVRKGAEPGRLDPCRHRAHRDQ